MQVFDNLLTACDTEVNTALTFGGQDWSISPDDFIAGQISRTECLGAFFDLDTGSSAPSWIVGDSFLVRLAHTLLSSDIY